jgi:hypothetical protein
MIPMTRLVKSFALMSVIMFASFLGAQARLGQTQAEVNAMYGAPVQRCEDPPGHVFWLYRHKGLHILVTFVGGRSEDEAYYRPGRLLSRGEVQSLLHLNSSGKAWRKQRTNEWWLGERATAVASYMSDEGMLSVMTMDYAKSSVRDHP